MRVLIDYRSALRSRSGAGEYVHQLAAALVAVFPPNSREHQLDVTVFSSSWKDRLQLTPELYCPARLDGPVTARVQELALRTHRAVGCEDFSRTDIRLRSDGEPFVLEINPLPGLSPVDSNFPLMGRAAGLSYDALIRRIAELAFERRTPPDGTNPQGRRDAR